MSDYSFIANAHPEYIEKMYNQYQQDPNSVEGSWASFFKGYEFASEGNGNGQSNGSKVQYKASSELDKEFGVLSIIHGFRSLSLIHI